MNSTQVSLLNDQELRVQDPELPTLTSEAAIDIDNMLSNQSIDLHAIRRLAGRLRGSIQFDAQNATPRSLMDPATLNVLGKAIANTPKHRDESYKMDQLLCEAAKIADVLSRDNPLENREELETARDFCVALSRAALSFRTYIRNIGTPPHPFRK